MAILIYGKPRLKVGQHSGRRSRVDRVLLFINKKPCFKHGIFLRMEIRLSMLRECEVSRNFLFQDGVILTLLWKAEDEDAEAGIHDRIQQSPEVLGLIFDTDATAGPQIA